MLTFFWIFAIISTSVTNATSIGTENPHLKVFTDGKGKGREGNVTEATTDLEGFNDKISSVQAVKGSWELYENKDYEGKRMLVTEGGIINAAHNDKYSSARPVCTYENDPAKHKITVFEHNSQQGNKKDYFIQEADLSSDSDHKDWGDKISSVWARKGEWELYEHDNYSGDRQLVKEGEQINVNNDHWSSLRPVCKPYSAIVEKCFLKTQHVPIGTVAQKTAGSQIVGIVMDSSCAGPAKGHLTMDRTDSVEESVAIEIANSEEVNWSLSVNVGVTAEGGFLGNGVEVSLGVETGAGGSHTYSSAETKETSNGYSQSVGHELEYETPAVAVLFGSVDKYIVTLTDVPVINYMQCPNGTKYTKESTMSLTSTSYQSADYWYLVKKLEQDFCDAFYTEIYSCMHNFREEYSSKLANRTTAKAEFDKCFVSPFEFNP